MEKELEIVKDKGINVEESMEEGQCNTPSANIWVRLNQNKPDFFRLSVKYKNAMFRYLAELKKRAHLAKEEYTKLIEDLLALRDNGFCASQSPQSYYYQSGKGFFIVDPHKVYSISDEEIVRCAFRAIFGNGLPEYYVEFESKNMITAEIQSLLQKAETICTLRLAEVLIAHGISYETTFDTITECHLLIDKETEVVDFKDFNGKMAQFYEFIKSKEMLNKEGVSLLFIQSK